MSETQQGTHATLCKVLSAELNPYMEAVGFQRGDNSLDYARPCDAGDQLLQMHFTFRPSLDPRANSHIYPWLRLKFPEVNRIASEMVGGQHGAIGTSDITLGQPLDFVVPKNAHVDWFTYGDENDYVLCVRSIKGYIEKWVIPFLNDHSTVNSLANYFEAKDERIPAQRHFYIYVAAAFILLQQPERAMQVLESKFGKVGPRREYAKAFEYVKKLIR
jgi:hypothetical protein